MGESLILTWVALALLAAYALADLAVRHGPSARGARGDASTRLVGAIFATAVLAVAATAAPGVRDARWPLPVAVTGVVLALAGLALRLAALRQLGRWYTRTLRSDEGHGLMTTGLYAAIRHPGYAGSLLALLGAGLATANWIALAAIAVTAPAAYAYRIHTEETLLTSVFGDRYRAYQGHTRRLIPFVW
ncbi:MAG: DUF1295 domain-containing protein [Propionibacteriaceae bacterium]|nr:DUF1295 domain-containing protein [Propionibacteriaceae bacterium]